VGFVVDKAVLEQVFSSTSVSPANNHSTNFSIIKTARDWHSRPMVAAVPSGPNLTPPPPQYTNLKKILSGGGGKGSSTPSYLFIYLLTYSVYLWKLPLIAKTVYVE
jgi:hypothetical protein